MLYYYGLFWQNFLKFDGRSRRAEFWYAFLGNLIIAFLIGIVAGILRMEFLSSLFSLVILIPNISVAIRRLHDIGKSGWWYLLGFIPLIGTIILLVWYAKEGDHGDNAYGPDPKRNSVF